MDKRFGRLGMVKTAEVEVDPTYGRGLRPSRVRKMVSEWDPAQMDPIKVNRRTGEKTYRLVDGMHRVETFKRIHEQTGDGQYAEIMAVIHEGWSAEEEANYFWRQVQRQPLTLPEQFKARIRAGEAEAEDIERIVHEQGFDLDYSDQEHASGARVIRALSAVQDIYRRLGRDGLAGVLRIIASAWPNDELAWSYHVLLGLATFEKAYRGQYDMDRLVQSLQDPRHLAMDLMREARQLSTANRLNTHKSMLPVLRRWYNSTFSGSRDGRRLQPIKREKAA